MESGFCSRQGKSIRCKIGSAVVIVRIFDQVDKYEVEVNASCGEANARSLLEVMRNA